MAKKFAGFKPETMAKKILPALGYDGPTDEDSINKFLAANPAAAAKMGKYTLAARQMVEGETVDAKRGRSITKRKKPKKTTTTRSVSTSRGSSSSSRTRSVSTSRGSSSSTKKTTKPKPKPTRSPVVDRNESRNKNKSTKPKPKPKPVKKSTAVKKKRSTSTPKKVVKKAPAKVKKSTTIAKKKKASPKVVTGGRAVPDKKLIAKPPPKVKTVKPKKKPTRSPVVDKTLTDKKNKSTKKVTPKVKTGGRAKPEKKLIAKPPPKVKVVKPKPKPPAKPKKVVPPKINADPKTKKPKKSTKSNAIKDFNKKPQIEKTAEAHQKAIRDFSKSIGTDKDSKGTKKNTKKDTTKKNTTNTKPLDDQTKTVTETKKDGTTTQKQSALSSADKLTGRILEGPSKDIKRADGSIDRSIVAKAPVVADMGEDKGTKIDPTDKKLTAGDAPVAEAATVKDEAVGQADMPDVKEAPQIEETAMASPKVDQVMEDTAPAEGEVSEDAQVEAAQIDPTEASSLSLDAAQIDPEEAQKVDAPDALEATEDQLIDGSAVDDEQVAETFGEGEVEAASVKDELDTLMEDFEGGNTPAWAAGAMRAATAQMKARGLSSSSMAGMAIVQAAMESALPIAQMDASNKQQMAMFKAEQRAKFMGMKFDQDFQAKVQNAARISEIANMNFSAEQQVALENARMAQTVDLANLDNRQAKVLADAATMTQMDMANLNNRQQAEVQNAQSFLQMDMANLDNAQQTSLFKAQQRVGAILSDTAAENATKQFNATSQAQTDQFFATLSTQVSQFNAEQKNAMERFNAGEVNAVEKFNKAQENAREEFNVKNHLVIAQANAQWAQSVTTAANAAANQANRDEAMQANEFTMTAYNNVVQRERDTLAWAWQSSENGAERDANIMIANISAGKDAKGGNMLSEAAGKFVGNLAINAADKIFSKFL